MAEVQVHVQDDSRAAVGWGETRWQAGKYSRQAEMDGWQVAGPGRGTGTGTGTGHFWNTNSSESCFFSERQPATPSEYEHM